MLYLPEAAIDVIKIFTLGVLSFLVAFLLTPFLTKVLYQYQLWRKEVRTQAIDGKDLTYFQKFHSQGETHIPRFGGLLIWLIPLFLAVFFYLIHKTGINIWWLQKLNFLNRGQTWLPFFALVSAALVGFLDDLLQVMGRGKYIAKGLTLRQRIMLMGVIGAVGAWWFYAKLEWSSLHVPGIGDFEIGIWYLPLFVIVMMATYSGGVIDGLDGLASGLLTICLFALWILASRALDTPLLIFLSLWIGALLAFLYFNVYPARIWLGDVGALSFGATLAVVGLLIGKVVALLIIGGIFVMEGSSSLIQILSKRFFKRKVFVVAPFHLWLLNKGWEEPKIVMRAWLAGIMLAILGLWLSYI